MLILGIIFFRENRVDSHTVHSRSSSPRLPATPSKAIKARYKCVSDPENPTYIFVPARNHFPFDKSINLKTKKIPKSYHSKGNAKDNQSG
jgi:hypothetical protein